MTIKYVLNINDVKEIDEDTVKTKFSKQDILIAKQKTGFGYKKFFVCPGCGERRTELYSYNQIDIHCRSCGPISPYEGITHTTKGGTLEITYRMYRIANKYNITLEFPFSYYQLLFKKPKHMRWAKWEEIVRKLQILENMRFQTIFLKKKYEAKLIRYILNDCPYIYLYSMCDIEKYLIDWELIAKKTKNTD